MSAGDKNVHMSAENCASLAAVMTSLCGRVTADNHVKFLI